MIHYRPDKYIVSALKNQFGLTHPKDTVQCFEPPEHDGYLKMTKGPVGFWRRTCSVCGVSTVNGVVDDPSEDKAYSDGEYLSHPSESETPAFKQLRDRYVSGDKLKWHYDSTFDSRELRDGTILKDVVYECPVCNSVLIRSYRGDTDD